MVLPLIMGCFMDNSRKNQSVNRAKRAAAIRAEIIEDNDNSLDTREIESVIGMSLRQVEREDFYLSDEGVIAQLFDKIA